MNLDEAVAMMRGKPGTSVELTLVRSSGSEPIELEVVRDNIKIKSVKSELIEKNIGYIRISQFQGQTAKELISSIDNLKEQSKNDLKGIALDLHNNPGGLLDAAVAVSDTFLDYNQSQPRKIVCTKLRNPMESIVSYTMTEDCTNDLPLVVLVNMGSASASEIVAGALQDHNRAVVVGLKTFGKGSVQTVIPISETSAVKLTTARYYTPNGHAIQTRGIIPDVIVEDVIIIDILPSLKEGDSY